MDSRNITRAFTLIELLTVIAIIAVLAAIIFPIAGTVREQARATSCMTNLHQLWVAANVYRQDEGGYPPALFGYVEAGTLDANNVCQPAGVPYTGTGCVVNLNRAQLAFMYPEQYRDSNLLLCPDNLPRPKQNDVTVAFFPPRPPNWPAGYSYISDSNADPNAPVNVCGTTSVNGMTLVKDCYVDGPLKGSQKLYYIWDSYDISPMVNPDGTPVLVSGQRVYERHYSLDWTGVTGATDLPDQLKYSNPPSDKTILAYCNWHSMTTGATTVPAINMAGIAKKLDLKLMLANGANVYNR